MKHHTKPYARADSYFQLSCKYVTENDYWLGADSIVDEFLALFFHYSVYHSTRYIDLLQVAN